MGESKLQCSFCKKSQDAIENLISSPDKNAYICAECVRVCVDILDGKHEKLTPAAPRQRFIPLWLLRMFGGRDSG